MLIRPIRFNSIILTLYCRDAIWVTEVSLDCHLHVGECGELDGGEDVVLGALREQNSRVGREVSRRQCCGQSWGIILSVRVRYNERLPGRDARNQE